MLLGPPGAGKGTQLDKILETHNLTPILMGELMRNEIRNKTDIGLELENYVNKGLLAPHDIAMKIVGKKLKELHDNKCRDIVFDGFPRAIEQALAIEETLDEIDKDTYKIDKVIFFDVTDENAIDRIHKRSANSTRADDLDDNIIMNRLKVFHEFMKFVLEHFKQKNKLYVVDGNKSIEEVYDDCKQYFTNYLK